MWKRLQVGLAQQAMVLEQDLVQEAAGQALYWQQQE